MGQEIKLKTEYYNIILLLHEKFTKSTKFRLLKDVIVFKV